MQPFWTDSACKVVHLRNTNANENTWKTGILNHFVYARFLSLVLNILLYLNQSCFNYHALFRSLLGRVKLWDVIFSKKKSCFMVVSPCMNPCSLELDFILENHYIGKSLVYTEPSITHSL